MYKTKHQIWNQWKLEVMFAFCTLLLDPLVNWDLTANSHSHLKTHPSSPRLLSYPSCTHSSLIGLAVGPEPKGRLYKTPHVLKAGVRKERGLWDSLCANRKTKFYLKYCNWKRWKMCKGLAALPQTCLERWDLRHHIIFPVMFFLMWFASGKFECVSSVIRFVLTTLCQKDENIYILLYI